VDVEAGTLFWIFAAGFATAVEGLALLALPNPSDRMLDGLLEVHGRRDARGGSTTPSGRSWRLARRLARIGA
jgi:hypothetical protein